MQKSYSEKIKAKNFFTRSRLKNILEQILKNNLAKNVL